MEAGKLNESNFTLRYKKSLPTILTASEYITSDSTSFCWVTHSTISCSAVLFTSFHFRSERGSVAKSKRTQHCRSFCTKSSSLSSGAASETNRMFYIWGFHLKNEPPTKKNKKSGFKWEISISSPFLFFYRKKEEAC